ncbi:hypothetical protein MAM1_0389d10250 [Mucor ambiguus]|uniref:Uncharacterized protein n=1 Tax=Mucor ambiguus TaxID=91626 RepID=A0A0C9LY61_9FUNG|nr:hypothetical protein MAM1_0389d10250 [Mucor ambiguus]
MSYSNYHTDTHDAHETTAVEEYRGQPSSNVRSPEHYHSAGKEKAVEYSAFPEPQLSPHSPHLDQTMFQNYDNETKVVFPMPYSHEKESEEFLDDAAISNPVFDSYKKESMTNKGDHDDASTSAAVCIPSSDDKIAANDAVQVPESTQVSDIHANGEDEDKDHMTYSIKKDTFGNKRDTLIGEDEHKDEKVALSDEQANEAQRSEDERRLVAKMEEETKDRVFQPETEPEAVYVPSVKPRADIAEQNCCWGCLAWICCWTSAAADKK